MWCSTGLTKSAGLHQLGNDDAHRPSEARPHEILASPPNLQQLGEETRKVDVQSRLLGIEKKEVLDQAEAAPALGAKHECGLL